MAVSKDLKELYKDQYAHGVESDWRRVGALDKAANVARAWKLISGANRPSVVELGCGEGAVANRLAELGFFSTYRGFDISSSGITQAQARSIPGAQFAVVDGQGIPVEDDSADLVVLTHVVEHLENPRHLLAEARRIAPKVIVEVPLELTEIRQ